MCGCRADRILIFDQKLMVSKCSNTNTSKFTRDSKRGMEGSSSSGTSKYAVVVLGTSTVVVPLIVFKPKVVGNLRTLSDQRYRISK